MSASSSDTQSSLPVHWVQWSTCPPPRSTHSCALFVMSRTALLTVALSRLSSNGLTSRKIERLIPAQPNFHTLYKSEQCSFKHELFLDVLVSDESWDHKLSIHVNHSPQNQIFFIRQPFQKCIVFFETHGIIPFSWIPFQNLSLMSLVSRFIHSFLLPLFAHFSIFLYFSPCLKLHTLFKILTQYLIPSLYIFMFIFI